MSIITIDPTKRMTKAEAEMHEKAIIDNIDDCGMRLLKIREERGWEVLDFKSFTDYAKSLSDKMSIGKVWGLIDQAEVNRNLTQKLGRPVHLPMKHALALKGLEPEKQVEAFNNASKGYKKGDPKPTESLFRKIASRFMPKKAAKKAARADDAGWSKEDLAKDTELAEAFAVIESVYGADDTNPMRDGTIAMKRRDVLFLSKLPRERMEAIQDLLFETRWTPEQCIKFINTDVDQDSATFYDDIKYQCLSMKAKRWDQTFDDGAFTVSIKLNTAAKR